MLARLKKIIISTFAVFVAVAFLCFAMINRETVTLDLSPFPFLIEMRLFLLVATLLVSGIFIGWIVSSFECRRRYLVKKETQRKLDALENEVIALRARHDLPDGPVYDRSALTGAADTPS